MNRETTHRVYLSLGANLGDPLQQLTDALKAIHALPRCDISACSPVYQTAVVGSSQVQPDYLNLVVSVETQLAPLPLWRELTAIESKIGRRRNDHEPRNSARVVDIDVLLYDQLRIESRELTVPHPRMHERAFVLRPLQDIAPAAVSPTLGELSELIAKLPPQRIARHSEPPAWI
ncbi:MAG: 2-amino-4-hydroxy-6-hydroxymethyldihydropteridine diphosphokinase [Betaproteobacteria bacterium]|nr:MAG: 2-amino-4-hydroxy-6-hydroxymethyldihydropteridine diphosphokinase [Betaproteobacteria bacterium]TAG47606.1 MAG: 2-amino-4-hydroxy-6-hydroxymethyldihydropteridine diphosphokinase [Betaproteobacteria bacterium]